jgi:hypothetical protein
MKGLTYGEEIICSFAIGIILPKNRNLGKGWEIQDWMEACLIMRQGNQDFEVYNVRATISYEDQKLNDVLCSVYLPVGVVDKPKLEFFPTGNQSKWMNETIEFSFEAQISGLGNKPFISFYSPSVFVSEDGSVDYGGGWQWGRITGIPNHLRVKHTHQMGKSIGKTKYDLWISPNRMLNPPMVRYIDDHSGNLSNKRINNETYQLNKGITLKFDKRFRTKETSEGEMQQRSHLVGVTEQKIPSEDVDFFCKEILPDIDDFLMIASLGSLTRTVCTGWRAIDNKSIMDYYRGDTSFPSTIRELDFPEAIVPPEHFPVFLRTCYGNFLKHPDNMVIRRAIYSLVPGHNRVIEESFYSLFTALESIISAFRRERSSEFIIQDRQQWKHLKKRIKTGLSQITEDLLNEKQRSEVYKKIDELNRVPFQTSFIELCKHYDINLLDLWPFFKNNNIAGIYEIRSFLMHGGCLPHDCLEPLVIATDSMIFVLGRVLTKVLGFPLEKTNLAPSTLKTRYWAQDRILDAQKSISPLVINC